MLSRITTRRTSERAVTTQYERRRLEDGSVAELNAGAQLDVQFTAAERRVTLRQGEALFTVAKNPARPFIVHAGGVNVRAVGTAFNVRLGAGSVEVLVTEGRVQVAPPATRAAEQGSRGLPASAPPTPAEVSAGQRAVVALAAGASPHVTPVSMEEVARALAWQPQLLDFSSAPLSRVVAEFNRSNRVQLVLADPDLRDLPIVASIRSDNLDGLVRLLTATGGIRAEHRGADEIILHAQK
jgi:transmembrane sensor